MARYLIANREGTCPVENFSNDFAVSEKLITNSDGDGA
jgi:hypothetical protein